MALYLVKYSKPRTTVGGQTGGGWINMEAESINALKKRAKREGIKLLKVSLVKNLCKFCGKNKMYKQSDTCLSCLKAMEFERDMSRPTR